jgi:hypothetical protein
MAGIKDLKLGKDVAISSDADWKGLPEQIGSRKAPLQPGPYRFKFPVKAAIAESYDAFDTEIGGKTVTRVVSILRDDAALTVIQAPAKYIDRVGESYGQRISNAERKRGKGDDAPMASDMDYVLATLDPEGKRPQTNRQYLESWERVVPEQELGADVEWNWRCDAKKPVRVQDPDAEPGTKTIALDGEEGREKRMGCGNKYYQKNVPKVDKDNNEDPAGEYPRTIDCECGAILFANDNLVNFRK